jgi:DNA-binding beta-propeller fold protein YncE
VVAAAAVTAVAAVAACSAGTHPAAGRSPSRADTAPARAIVPARVPGCSTAAAPAPELTRVPTAMESAPGSPFGVVVTEDGSWSFVAMSGDASLGVFRIGRSGLPDMVHRVSLTGPPVGETLTHDGRYLLAADSANGALVISVARAEAGQADAQAGTLGSGTGDAGAIEVAVSPDDRFAFVSLEDWASIAVYNLRRALEKGFSSADLVGMIPVGIAPVGLAVSPDGRWLYATSEAAREGPVSAAGGGTLTVIGLRRAETDPAASVVATVDAGCSPVRVITSANGSVVWVTARESDRLLGFSAARLRTDPARSLIASVEVGEAPVGLALVDSGSRIVVADSNRFSASGAASSLAVVDVADALAGRAALSGYLPAGGFPREMALAPDGRALFVTNFSSGQLEVVAVGELPCAEGLSPGRLRCAGWTSAQVAASP